MATTHDAAAYTAVAPADVASTALTSTAAPPADVPLVGTNKKTIHNVLSWAGTRKTTEFLVVVCFFCYMDTNCI